MPTKLPKVSVIGAGTVGSALAIALCEKGYPIASVISRTGSSSIELARSVKCKKASTQIKDIAAETEIVLIAVSDDAIGTIATELAKLRQLKFKKLLAIHCSGVHSADILQPLKRKGALVASMHPVQTFPMAPPGKKLHVKLKGIYYGIDGDSNATLRVETIIQNLDGKSIIIPKELKSLYHVVCVFASNYMTIFLNTISELSRVLNLKATWMEVFGPLMTSTMENVVRTSSHSALTGPIVRGDLATLDLHLKTLLEHTPQLLPLYTIGGIEIARIAKEDGKITQEEFQEVITKFRKFIQKSSIKNISKVKR